MNNLKIGDLVIPRRKGGMLQSNAEDATERQLKAGEETQLGLIMKKHKLSLPLQDRIEMPQYMISNIKTGKELWYYESDLTKIVKEPADKDATE